MTNLLETLKALHAKATPGPLSLERKHTGEYIICAPDDDSDHDNRSETEPVADMAGWGEQLDALAELKVEAINALPALMEAVEALGPFAKLADAILPSLPDHYKDHDIYIGVERASGKAGMSYGHLRRARTAYAKLQGVETDA